MTRNICLPCVAMYSFLFLYPCRRHGDIWAVQRWTCTCNGYLNVVGIDVVRATLLTWQSVQTYPCELICGKSECMYYECGSTCNHAHWPRCWHICSCLYCTSEQQWSCSDQHQYLWHTADSVSWRGVATWRVELLPDIRHKLHLHGVFLHRTAGHTAQQMAGPVYLHQYSIHVCTFISTYTVYIPISQYMSWENWMTFSNV